jgi:Ser/Thr protein kinase RdoA (MazF antagonist)
VRPYETLTPLGQRRRLRHLARVALEHYGRSFSGACLTPPPHEQNATFRVDADEGRFVLRISRSELHTSATIGCEMAWLAALRDDARLPVPEPVPSMDGSLAVSVEDGAVPGEHPAVLLRWLEGRFSATL